MGFDTVSDPIHIWPFDTARRQNRVEYGHDSYRASMLDRLCCFKLLAAACTMDELFQDHDRLAALPPEQIPSILARVAAIQSVLTARLLAIAIASATSEPKSATTDQLLTAEDAAVILRVTPRWLYRHANRLPFTRRLSRKCLRFSEAGLRRWQTSKRA